MREVKFQAYSSKNKDKLLEVIETEALVCTSVSGYKNLGINMEEIKRFLKDDNTYKKVLEERFTKKIEF